VRFVLAVIVLAGCVQPRSGRCERTCAREYECVKETPQPAFDEKQCISVCSALEATPQAARVEAHAQCVQAHATCSEALECTW
jgi:hypothetical protein